MRFSSLKTVLTKLPVTIVTHLLVSVFVLLIIAGVIGFAFFYSFVVIPKTTALQNIQQPSLLQEDIYNEVQEAWRQQELLFEQAATRTYTNPFQRSAAPPEEGLTENEE